MFFPVNQPISIWKKAPFLLRLYTKRAKKYIQTAHKTVFQYLKYFIIPVRAD